MSLNSTCSLNIDELHVTSRFLRQIAETPKLEKNASCVIKHSYKSLYLPLFVKRLYLCVGQQKKKELLKKDQ